MTVGGWPLALLLCLTASPAASATPHMPLLPRPQHIVYGEGQLDLQGLQISLPTDATAEDNFAAHRLSACLGSRNDKGPGNQPVSITSSSPHPDRSSVCAEPAPSMHCPSREKFPVRIRAKPTRLR